jgi:Mce-associated membrane protein
MKLDPDPKIEGDTNVAGTDGDIDEYDRDRDLGAVDKGGVAADGETTDSAAEKPAVSVSRPRAMRTLRRAASFSWRGIHALLARWRLVSLGVAVVAAIGLAGTSFFLQYRPNQQTDDVARHAAIKVASDGTVALLSYSPETLDRDVAAGKSHLTGELLRYFTGLTEYFVGPAVRQQGVRASASVLRAAVADMHPNSAVVLVFVHQTTASKDKPDPILSTNNVRVTLAKVDGSWRIARFEPE